MDAQTSLKPDTPMELSPTSALDANNDQKRRRFVQNQQK